MPTPLVVGQVMMWNGSIWENASIGTAGRTFDVKVYGAKGDNSTDDTADIQEAINECEAAGGGTVFFPTGTYINSSSELVIDSPNVRIEMAPGAKIVQTLAQYGKSCIQIRANRCSVKGWFDSSVSQGGKTASDNGDKDVIAGSYESQPARDRASAVYVAAGVEDVDIDVKVSNFVNGIKINGTDVSPVKRIKVRLVCESMDFGLLAVGTEDLDAICWGFDTWTSQGGPPHTVYLSDGSFAPTYVHKRFHVKVYDAGQTLSSPAKIRGCSRGQVDVYSGQVARGIDLNASQFVTVMFNGTLVADTNVVDDTAQAGVRIEDCSDCIISDATSVYIEDNNDTIFGVYATNSPRITIRGTYRASRSVVASQGLIRLASSSNDCIIDRPILRNDGADAFPIELLGGNECMVIKPTLAAGQKCVEVDSGITSSRIILDPDLFADGFTLSTAVSDSGTSTVIRTAFNLQSELAQLPGALSLDAHQTVAAFSSSQNDLAIQSDVVHVRLSATADVDLTGIVPGYDRRLLILTNGDADETITIKNQATSTAANRFQLPVSADFALLPQSSALFIYDTGSTRWRLIGSLPAMNQRAKSVSEDVVSAATSANIDIAIPASTVMTFRVVVRAEDAAGDRATIRELIETMRSGSGTPTTPSRTTEHSDGSGLTLNATISGNNLRISVTNGMGADAHITTRVFEVDRDATVEDS